MGLRERFFGNWEGMSAEHYDNIWQRDEVDKHSDDGVERPKDVAQRGLNVIDRLERQYQGEVILLVSHGDMLQILSTSIAGISPHKHRSLPHHQTGEIKYLVAEHQ